MEPTGVLSDNCIKFVDPKTGRLLPDIPCVNYIFPNFNNLKFKAAEFDEAILKWYGNGNPVFNGKSQYQYPKEGTNAYINRKLPKKKELQEHQKFVSKYINLHNNFTNGCLIYHQLGSGKCHEKGTPILMYDGSVKKVENIKVGEKIMGDDSTPRKILELVRGKDVMYKIVPTKGEPFVCNSDHILSLKCSNFGVHYSDDKRYKNQTKFYVAKYFDNKELKMRSKWFETKQRAENFLKSIPEKDKYCDVSIKDYLKLSNGVKNQLKLYRVGVDFKEKKVPFSPYILGVWLGDGTGRTTEITNQDAEILNGIRRILKKDYKTLYMSFNTKSEYTYRICSTTKTNKFMSVLRKLKILNNKRIPDIYKINSKKVRLEILAGIIDTDGHLDRNGGYEITQKNENLLEDIIYLCRSLGFSAYKNTKKTSWTHKGVKKYGKAFRIHVYGKDIDKIPVKIKRKISAPRLQKKNPLVTSFKLIKKPVDNYYGFTIDKNHRYLLGDFTVTHNSCSSIVVGEAYKAFMNPYGQRNIFVVTPKALQEQVKDEIIGKFIEDNNPFGGNGYLDACTSDIRVIRDNETYQVTVKPDLAKGVKLSEKVVDKSKLTREQLVSYNRKKILEEERVNKYQEARTNALSTLRWRFYTHDTFINRIDDQSVRDTKNEKIHEQAEDINSALRDGNSLFIFDEIQNLITDPDREIKETGKRYRILSDVLRIYNNKNNRYVLLTATPIRNRPYEIGLLLNLINPRLMFPETKNEFNRIFMDGDNNFINQSLFRWMCKGYVSYFRGGNPDLFPRKKVTYMYHKMCPNQARVYNDLNLKRKKKKDKALEELVESDSKDFQIQLRQISYNYPESTTKIEQGMKQFGGIKYFEEYISPKLAQVAEMVNSTKEKSFIYSEFINYGITPLIMLFEKLGYEIVYGTKRESFTTKKPRILIWTGSKGERKKGEEGIYPELKEKPNTKEIARIVKDVFNEKSNKNGEYIKAIIGSSAIKEGISFKNVNNVHLLSPWWNNARTDQIIARAIRFGSHDSGATVNVYRHITVMFGGTVNGYNLDSLSVEQYMDVVSERKTKINRNFELALKESSVDCVLNRYGNLIRLTEVIDEFTPGNQYYLDESTGDTFNKNLQKIKIVSKTTRFSETRIHEEPTLFKSISSRHKLVSEENLKCGKKAEFRWTKETEDEVKKLIKHNEKNELAPLIFKLLDEENKKFKKCLNGKITGSLKVKYDSFIKEDKERKKLINNTIQALLNSEGIPANAKALREGKTESYRNDLRTMTNRQIQSLLSSLVMNSRK